MKSYYTKTKLTVYFLSLLVVTTLVSCGAAQSVSDSDDGIYAEDTEQPKRRVIVNNQKEYDDYNENYFTKELERLDDLNGTDIITDIENYSSEDYDFEDVVEDEEEPENQISTNREPWGYSNDSDVVVNVNTFGNGFGWGFYDPLWDPFWNNQWGFGWGNRWGWGWNRWGWNNWGWGYDPFCPPFWNNGFYAGGFYGNRFRYGFRGNRFNRFNRYGYNRGYGRGIYGRNAIASRNRRAYARNSSRVGSRRSNVYRRGNRTVRRSNGNVYRNRRGTTSTRNSRSSSRINRNSSSNRNYSSNRSSRSSRSRSYNNSSSRSSRSYSGSRSSSRRSYSSGRSSSSRSSGRSYSRSSRRR